RGRAKSGAVRRCQLQSRAPNVRRPAREQVNSREPPTTKPGGSACRRRTLACYVDSAGHGCHRRFMSGPYGSPLNCHATNWSSVMPQSKKRTFIAAVSLALVVAGSATTASSGRGANTTRLPRGSEPVKIDPSDFSPNIDNRQWPMTTGSRWVYRVTDMATGSVKRQVITVTNRTKVMADGVR